MQTSPSLASLAVALSAAQGELVDASKSSFNPAFKSKYADLAEILQTVRPVLSKHGLSVVQTPGAYSKEAGVVALTTLLLHKSGEFITDTLFIPLPKADAPGLGNAITYGRRYSLAAIVGISQDDDDGNSIRVEADKRAKATPASSGVSDLTKALETVTKEGFPGLAGDFAKLPAADQGKVLPAVNAARARLGL